MNINPLYVTQIKREDKTLTKCLQRKRRSNDSSFHGLGLQRYCLVSGMMVSAGRDADPLKALRGGIKVKHSLSLCLSAPYGRPLE